MAGALEETVGARLKVVGRAPFVADLQASAAAVNDLADAFDKAAAASDRFAASSKASTAGVAAQADASKVAAASSTEAAAAQTKAAESQAAAADKTALAASGAAVATGRAADSMGTHLNRASMLAGKVLKLGGLGFAGIAYEGMKAWSGFQQAMTQVSTQGGISMRRIGLLDPGVIRIAERTGLAFSDVADQLYRIASATGGLHLTNRELHSLTQAAANLTVLGGPNTDPEQTARVFGAVMTSGIGLRPGQKGATPNQIAAWANAVVGSGDMRMSDLVSALGTGVLTSGSMYGVGLNNLGAWIDLMTSQAMGGSKAGTLINHAISLLASPNQAASTVEHLFGFNKGELAQIMRTKGIFPAISALRSAMRHVELDPNFYTKWYGPGVTGEITYLRAAQFTPAQIAQMMAPGHKGGLSQNMVNQMLVSMFGGAKQLTPIAMLMNERGLFNEKLRQIGGMSNPRTFQTDLAHTLDEVANQIKIAERKIQGAAMIFGKDITPYFIDFLHVIEKVGNFLGHEGWARKTLLYGGAGIMAGAAAIKLTKGLQDVWHGLGSLGHLLHLPGFAGRVSGSTRITTPLVNITADVVKTGGLGGTGGVASGFESSPFLAKLGLAATALGSLAGSAYFIYRAWHFATNPEVHRLIHQIDTTVRHGGHGHFTPQEAALLAQSGRGSAFITSMATANMTPAQYNAWLYGTHHSAAVPSGGNRVFAGIEAQQRQQLNSLARAMHESTGELEAQRRVLSETDTVANLLKQAAIQSANAAARHEAAANDLIAAAFHLQDVTGPGSILGAVRAAEAAYHARR